MQELREQIMRLSQSDFENLLSWMISTEKDRRERESSAEAAQARVIQELIESGKIPGPDYATLEEAFNGAEVPEWKNPNGDITRMYPKGAVVRVGDEMFLSTLENRMNSTEPGTDDSWENVTDEVRVANQPPEVRNAVDLSDEPDYFSEPSVPKVARNDQFGLEDRQSPPTTGLEYLDPEPEPSA